MGKTDKFNDILDIKYQVISWKVAGGKVQSECAGLPVFERP